MTEVNLVSYGSCLDSSPVLRKNDMVETMEIQKWGKMALSLPLISQTVGIWAMTHKYTNDLWVTFVYHSRFGGLPFRGS